MHHRALLKSQDKQAQHKAKVTLDKSPLWGLLLKCPQIWCQNVSIERYTKNRAGWGMFTACHLYSLIRLRARAKSQNLSRGLHFFSCFVTLFSSMYVCFSVCLFWGDITRHHLAWYGLNRVEWNISLRGSLNFLTLFRWRYCDSQKSFVFMNSNCWPII